MNPDSISYQEYWSRETDRCINGFKPKGMKKISGKNIFWDNVWENTGKSWKRISLALKRQMTNTSFQEK